MRAEVVAMGVEAKEKVQMKTTKRERRGPRNGKRRVVRNTRHSMRCSYNLGPLLLHLHRIRLNIKAVRNAIRFSRITS